MSSTLAAIILALVAPPSPTSGPDIFGPLSGRLTSGEAVAVSSLLRSKHSQPWALLGWRSQTLPETWHLDAFLPPAVSGGRLRRGKSVRLQCVPTGDRCQKWEIADDLRAYAQVADGAANFVLGVNVRGERERPIQIEGDLADDVLKELVHFVRSSPGVPTRRGKRSPPVDGTCPIIQIVRDRADVFTVHLSRSWSHGQTASVRRKGGRFQLLSSSYWVS